MITGCTKAESVVVEARSNSRNTRLTSCEQGDEAAGQSAFDELGHTALMRRIDVGVEQADRDRLVVAGLELRQQVALQRDLVERLRGGSVCEHALADLEGVAPRHDRLRLLVEQVVDLPAIVALQTEQVAKALGHQEGEARAFALENRVGGDGRAVREILDRGEVQPRRLDRVVRPDIRARRRAGYLGDHDPVAVEGDEIRECAADFDAYAHVLVLRCAGAEVNP